MDSKQIVVFVLVVAMSICGLAGGKELGWKASGKNGAVSSGPVGSTEAGLEILKAGGNAMDAAAGCRNITELLGTLLG